MKNARNKYGAYTQEFQQHTRKISNDLTQAVADLVAAGYDMDTIEVALHSVISLRLSSHRMEAGMKMKIAERAEKTGRETK